MTSPTLLIDSGSTKTAWCWLVPRQAPTVHRTEGINPNFQKDEAIRPLLASVPLPLAEAAVVHYYGAGISGPENEARLQGLLREVCPQGQVQVHTDLLGAARATAGTEPALVGILGTGSHLCFYSGQAITKQALSLGYLLTDEGSGAHLGQAVLRAYFKGALPEALHASLAEEYALDRATVLHALYGAPYPNRYLASFARWVLEHSTHPWCQQLLSQHFHRYFEEYLGQFPKAHHFPLHLVGGVAAHGRVILQEVARAHGVALGKVVDSPLEGLIAYHQKEAL